MLPATSIYDYADLTDEAGADELEFSTKPSSTFTSTTCNPTRAKPKIQFEKATELRDTVKELRTEDSSSADIFQDRH